MHYYKDIPIENDLLEINFVGLAEVRCSRTTGGPLQMIIDRDNLKNASETERARLGEF